MKRFFLAIACLLSIALLQAQEAEANHISDKDRVALTPVIEDSNIPANAHKQLINKMTQIAAKNGCAATSNSRFVITCSADVLTQDITPTAPPMHAYTLAIHFYVGDGVEGRLFSSTTIEAKGVGQTPDKAYLNALKNVKVNDPAFKALVDKGKTEIINYYNTQCDLVIAEAKAKAARQEYTAALEQLTGVPQVCEECYRKALDQSVVVYHAWRDQVCNMALNKAQIAWSKRDIDATAKALEDVPVDGACYDEAKALRQAISAKLDANERKEWDLKMEEFDNRMRMQQESVAIQRQQATAAGAATAVSAPKEQIRSSAVKAIKAEQEAHPAPQPTYQIKGKWFK